MLIDSNIIIYAARPEHENLRQFIAEHTPAVSAVSYVEVLGYHNLTKADQGLFEEFFASSVILPISQGVIEQAVQLRQERRMTLGDSLVAGTALIHQRTLVTRNTKDFLWINDLEILNPFERA